VETDLTEGCSFLPRRQPQLWRSSPDVVESLSGPAWSPDGKSLAFVAYYYPYGPRGDYVAALTMRLDRTHVELRLSDIEPGTLTVDWSPDGKSLLFGARISLWGPPAQTRPLL
jgi:Tol biopolymer transport system component